MRYKQISSNPRLNCIENFLRHVDGEGYMEVTVPVPQSQEALTKIAFHNEEQQENLHFPASLSGWPRPPACRREQQQRHEHTALY